MASKRIAYSTVRVSVEMIYTQFRAMLIREVITQLQSNKNSSTQKIGMSVAEQGLAAEEDGRLSLREKEVLVKVLDSFQKRLIENAMYNEEVGDEAVKMMRYLTFFCKECIHRRFVRIYEDLLMRLLLNTADVVTNLTPVHLELITVIVKRLEEAKDDPGVRDQIIPLGSRIIARIEESLANTGAMSKKHIWVKWIYLVCDILEIMDTMPKTVDPLVTQSIINIQQACTEDEIRFASAKLLAVSVSVDTGADSWTRMMGILVPYLKRLSDIICTPIELEEFEWNEQEFEEDNLGQFALPHVDSQSILPVVQVFAGALDLLERMLTVSAGNRSVPFTSIADILIRILSLDLNELGRAFGTEQSFEYLACLSSLQAACWEMLRVLIVFGGSTVLYRSRKLGTALVHWLDNTDKTADVRLELYRTASTYVRLAGPGAVMELAHSVWKSVEYTMKHALKDPESDAKAAPTSKKRKNPFGANWGSALEPGLDKKMFDIPSKPSQTELAIQEAVLELLATLLEVALYAVPDTVLDSIREHIASICLSFKREEVWVSASAMLAAYKVMLYAVRGPHCPASLTRMADWMFREGTSSLHSDVKAFCHEAVAILYSLPFNPLLDCQEKRAVKRKTEDTTNMSHRPGPSASHWPPEPEVATTEEEDDKAATEEEDDKAATEEEDDKAATEEEDDKAATEEEELEFLSKLEASMQPTTEQRTPANSVDLPEYDVSTADSDGEIRDVKRHRFSAFEPEAGKRGVNREEGSGESNPAASCT